MPQITADKTVAVYIYSKDGTEVVAYLIKPKILFTDKTILVTEQDGDPQWILLKADVESFVARRLS